MLRHYNLALLVPRSVCRPFLVIAPSWTVTRKRVIHSFHLAEYMLLRRPTIEPTMVTVTQSIHRREESVRVTRELVIFHKPSSDTAKRLIIIAQQGTS